MARLRILRGDKDLRIDQYRMFPVTRAVVERLKRAKAIALRPRQRAVVGKFDKAERIVVVAAPAIIIQTRARIRATRRHRVAVASPQDQIVAQRRVLPDRRRAKSRIAGDRGIVQDLDPRRPIVQFEGGVINAVNRVAEEIHRPPV